MITHKNCPVCGSENISEFLKTKDYFFTGEEYSLYKCSGCEIVFTNPRPGDDELWKYYKTENYLSHNAKSLSPVSLLYRFVRNINVNKKYRLVTKYVSKGKILDIGSGTGELLKKFKDEGWDTKGIEPDNDARSFAKNEYSLDISDLDELEKLNNASFDVITMWHVLEHVPDPNQRIETVKRLLKPEGILVIAVPNIDSKDFLYYKKFWAGLDVPRHLYHFSSNSISNLISKYGLKIVEEIPMKFDSMYVSWLSEKYKNSALPFFKGVLKGIGFNKNARKDGQYSSKIFVIKP